jgi:phenol 2-monooxygenase (NADPH)
MSSGSSINGPEADVDVLIIGAGPAGSRTSITSTTNVRSLLKILYRLMLANWFNHSTVKYRIIEKKPTRVAAGQADGLKCLTMEILHSIGIGAQIESAAWRIDEQCFWDPDESGLIRRSKTIPDVVPGLKKPREFTLGQGDESIS